MSGHEGRMIDRANYSNDTLNTYGYLSAYFIDMYYNHLYSEAITLHTKKAVSSITSGYKCTLDAFIKGLNSLELYKNCIQGIHQSFLQHGYPSLSFTHCIDKIVNEFIPQDYFKIMSFDDKSQFLRKIICDSNKKMILHIVKPPSTLLKDIIDNHADVENINILQDQYIDILVMLREQFYQQFVEINTGTATDNQMLIAMEKEIKLLYNEKHNLDKEIFKLKQDIINHKKIVLKLKQQCIEKDNYISELDAQSNNLNSENKDMFLSSHIDNNYHINTSTNETTNSINSTDLNSRLKTKEKIQSNVKLLYDKNNRNISSNSHRNSNINSTIGINNNDKVNDNIDINNNNDNIDINDSESDSDAPSKEITDNQSVISQESENDLFLIDD